ncbi:hypothetical protein KGP36_01835 [Patescibacteria group bacterium]|nr:hypothetical protein [Patescibacteria group bacterium]
MSTQPEPMTDNQDFWNGKRNLYGKSEPKAQDLTPLIHEKDLREFVRLTKLGYRAEEHLGHLTIIDPFHKTDTITIRNDL